MQPLVYILVLHWRGIENTRLCLTSVRKLNYENFKILLVDNGSETQDGAKLKTEFDEIEVLRLTDNRGFSGGCNAGITYSADKKAECVWILNNDTQVRADSLSLLIDAAKKNQRAAALSAAVLDSVPREKDLPDVTSKTNQENLNSSLDKIIPGRGIIDFRRAKSLLKPCAVDEPVECEWLAASNLLVRVASLRGQSAFDERYFLYFEDTELCHRLTLQGWQCLLVPLARIEHTGGASTGGNLQHWRSYYYTRNRMLFFSTYAPFPMRILSMLAIHAHLLRHQFSLPAKGAAGKQQLKAELLGRDDFNRGRFGKCEALDIFT